MAIILAGELPAVASLVCYFLSRQSKHFGEICGSLGAMCVVGAACSAWCSASLPQLFSAPTAYQRLAVALKAQIA